MIGCLRVRKQPIIALYFEFVTVDSRVRRNSAHREDTGETIDGTHGLYITLLD